MRHLSPAGYNNGMVAVHHAASPRLHVAPASSPQPSCPTETAAAAALRVPPSTTRRRRASGGEWTAAVAIASSVCALLMLLLAIGGVNNNGGGLVPRLSSAGSAAGGHYSFITGVAATESDVGTFSGDGGLAGSSDGLDDLVVKVDENALQVGAQHVQVRQRVLHAQQPQQQEQEQQQQSQQQQETPEDQHERLVVVQKPAAAVDGGGDANDEPPALVGVALRGDVARVAQVLATTTTQTPAPIIVLPTMGPTPPPTTASAVRVDSLVTNSPTTTVAPNGPVASISTVNNFNSRRHGLSGGQIAGIVIGCVAAGVLLAVGIYYLWRYYYGPESSSESSSISVIGMEPVAPAAN